MIREINSILLVEDNPDDADLIQEALKEAEHPKFLITHVSRLQDACAMLAEQPFNAILLDLHLPDSNGLETVTRISRAASNIPIVVLTGLDDEEIALQTLQLGAQDYLNKDTAMDENLLVKTIRFSIERNLKNTFNSTGLALWDWNIPSGKIIFGQTWTELFGYTPEVSESIHQFWEQLTHPDDRPLINEFIDAHLSGKTTLTQFEVRVVLPSEGDYKWVLLSGKTVQFDESGNPFRVVGSLQDIHQKKSKEIEYRSLFDNSINGIAYFKTIFDRNNQLIDLQVVDLNHAFKIHMGLKEATSVDHQTTQLLSELKKNGRTLLEMFETVERTGQVQQVEYYFDHLQKWLAISLYSPRRGYCALVTEDITVRKMAVQTQLALTYQLEMKNEELVRASKLKDEFLAMMSHELRTPLNAIMGLAQILQEKVYGSLTDEQANAIVILQDSGRHLLKMINDILDLSRINAGKIQIQIDRVDIKLVCDDCMRLVETQARAKNIELTSQLVAAGKTMQTDEKRLRLMLMHLLSNAVKFTPTQGQVVLESHIDNQKQAVIFIIKDTGIGIAKENIDLIFGPFFQIDSRLSRQHEGTGLGLALVKKSVELLGGKITVESQMGRGSQFCVFVTVDK